MGGDDCTSNDCIMTTLSPWVILLVIAAYFLILIGFSYWTSARATDSDFYIGSRRSPWILVAIGMIGASLSGVTFISIPGLVGAGKGNMEFSYMQMVMGYLVGYAVIMFVLMPMYYRRNLTSIYQYLGERFGARAYKMGAFYFLLSRTIGAAFRLFLVALVLDAFVTGPLGLAFWHTVAITIVLILTYTFKGGIKTIVWTDTLQTISMIAAVLLTVFALSSSLGIGIWDIPHAVSEAGLGQWFFFENGWSDPNNFYKQFLAGALIAIVMTGLDQDMMQKNLSCPNIKDAQKNMALFSIILFVVNAIFLTMGALLYMYARKNGIEIPAKSDQLYPLIALKYLSPYIGLVFIVGLIAAAYSSADSALTALTTSFCVDILDLPNDEIKTDRQKTNTRRKVHLIFALILFFVIIIYNWINNDAVINNLFKIAGYTYGPILGMFAFGMLTDRKVKDQWIPWVVLLAPTISYLMDTYSDIWFGGFKFGFLIIALNGLLTFLGMVFISKPQILKGESIKRL